MYGDYLMFRYSFWPGTYSFKDEAVMMFEFIREKINALIKRTETAE